jgi:hypothetical protein
VVLDKQGGSFRAMVHFHCRLNGRPYDGCRTGGYLDLQQQNPSTGDRWVINSAALSAPDTVASCADSHTYADSGWYATPLTGLTPGWFTQLWTSRVLSGPITAAPTVSQRPAKTGVSTAVSVRSMVRRGQPWTDVRGPRRAGRAGR